MKTKDSAVLILAAGLGKRMKSKRAKVLHPLAGRPLIIYVLETARRLAPSRIVVVVGHQSEAVREVLAPFRVEFVHQDEPRGTGHAVLMTRPALSGFEGTVVILNADVPLITFETIQKLMAAHRERSAALTVLTATLPDPSGYGRIERDREGRLIRVVEEADASPVQKTIREINTGFYAAEPSFLFPALEEIKTDNAQKEYYLTDLVEVALERGARIQTEEVLDVEEVLGINSRADLARIQKIFYARIARRHMADGVTLMDPETAWIDPDVTIGRDTLLYPNVRIEKGSRLGEDCVIHSYSRITSCRVGNRVTVREACIMIESEIADEVSVGPFAHVRPGTRLEEKSRIGNFVEIKNTQLGRGSKANHLTYLGDASVGKRVNIGAGTITCNYDGVQKHPTVIGDDVFVGSDTQFIAPVKVGRGATIGAGSTITRDIPAHALSIARARQADKRNWAKKKRGKRKKR